MWPCRPGFRAERPGTRPTAPRARAAARGPVRLHPPRSRTASDDPRHPPRRGSSASGPSTGARDRPHAGSRPRRAGRRRPDAAVPRRARRRRRQEARVPAVHPIARPLRRAPLVVTADPDVLDDLLRLAATAGTRGARSPPTPGRRAPAWSTRPARAGRPGRRPTTAPGSACRGAPDVVLRRRSTSTTPASGSAPSRVGAEHVVFLPDAERWLADRLADAAEGGGPAGAARRRRRRSRRGRRDDAGLRAGRDRGARRAARRCSSTATRSAAASTSSSAGRRTAACAGATSPRTRGRVPATVLAERAAAHATGCRCCPGTAATARSVPVEAVESVLAAGRRAHDLVVVDLPRTVDEASRVVLGRRDDGAARRARRGARRGRGLPRRRRRRACCAATCGSSPAARRRPGLTGAQVAARARACRWSATCGRSRGLDAGARARRPAGRAAAAEPAGAAVRRAARRAAAAGRGGRRDGGAGPARSTRAARAGPPAGRRSAAVRRPPAAVAAALREEGGPLLGDADTRRVLRALQSEIVGAGPLEPLLRDPAVTDVLVNGPGEVWVDRGAGLERTAVRFADDAAVRRLAQRLAAPSGRRLDDAQPWVDARLPGGVRLHAVLPPVAPGGHLPVAARARGRGSSRLDELVAAGVRARRTAPSCCVALVRLARRLPGHRRHRHRQDHAAVGAAEPGRRAPTGCCSSRTPASSRRPTRTSCGSRPGRRTSRAPAR